MMTFPNVFKEYCEYTLGTITLLSQYRFEILLDTLNNVKPRYYLEWICCEYNIDISKEEVLERLTQIKNIVNSLFIVSFLI